MAARGRLPTPPRVNNLAAAIKYEDPELVRSLLESGHDPNIHIDSGKFLLEEACLRKNVEIVKILLEFGSEPELCSGKHGEVRPLHIAAINGSVEIIEELLIAGADIELMDGNGWTALHRAVERENIPAVQTLLKYGANPDSRCHDCRVKLFEGQEVMYLGHCPLMTSIERGSLSLVEILLQTNKVDVNYVTAGTSNLVMALVRCQDQIAKRLLEAGADPSYCNSSGCTPLFYTSSPKLVDLLLTNGAHPDGCQDVTCQNPHKRTPLMWYVNSWSAVRSSSCARLLIHRGCDLNHKDADTGRTPLDAALERRQIHVARALIIYGCEVSKENIQVLMHVGNSDKDVMDFCYLWVFNPAPLAHLCILRIRKILQYDFKKKLGTLSLMETPVVTIRNILMEDIYEEIRGPL